MESLLANAKDLFLINAYFYNNHDLRNMLQWSKNCGRPWRNITFLYLTEQYNLATFKVEIQTELDIKNFTIPELPNALAKYLYPIKGIIVPNPGYGKENDVRNLQKYSNVLGLEQIFW